MHSGLEWVGAIVVCLLALAVLLVAFVFAHDSIERRLERRRMRIGELAVRQFCNTLHQYSWWFSEDKPTAELLREVSNYDSGCDISRLRDQWRAARKT